MQTNKAKYHLKRIQTILNLHNGEISRLDRDILLDDIRQLYDLVLNSEDSPPAFNPETPRDNTYVAPAPAPVTQETDNIPQNKPTDESTASSQKDSVEKIEPVIHDASLPEENLHTPTTITYEKTSENTDEQMIDTPAPTSSANEKMNGKTEDATSNVSHSEEYPEVLVEENESYPELFDFPTTNDLSDRLSSSKIEQLNKILTINDKILFINHLFNGEAIPFQENLKKFENFYTYEEAKKYAAEELVEIYNWTKSEKFDIVRQFMRQVKRLY